MCAGEHSTFEGYAREMLSIEAHATSLLGVDTLINASMCLVTRASPSGQVSPRYTHTGAVAALQKLRAVRYVKHRNREEVDAMAVDLDLPFDSDEVGNSVLILVIGFVRDGDSYLGSLRMAIDCVRRGGEGGDSRHILIIVIRS